MNIIKEYKPSVLVDTNVVSNAVSLPTDKDSEEILKYKKTSRKLFGSLKGFNLSISSTVSDEISLGNPASVAKRKNLVYGIEVLDITQEIVDLAEDFMKEKVFRPKAENDALILAAACFYKINYLVTCNMKDLANDKKFKEMIRVAKKHGYTPPTIFTPGKLLRKYRRELAKVREESANYFHKFQDLSYNVDTMKNIEHKEETILEECRRIRNQLSAEYAKDPKKYLEKQRARLKAEGVKFRTKPFPPLSKKAEAIVEKHRKEFYGEFYSELEAELES